MTSPAIDATEIAGFDYLKLENFLPDEHKALVQDVRAFVRNTVWPNINQYWDKAEFPWEIVMELKQLPILGGMIRGFGSAGLDPMALGMVMYELAKGDGSITTFYGVHSGLAMGSIGLLGSNEQRERWLPAMSRLEKIGAFGRPSRSAAQPVDLQTSVKRDGDHYFLNGAKRWIGNASIADILIIWARDDEGKFGGYVIENPKEVDGVTITDLIGKIGKRSVLNADITLNNVRVPVENRLEKANSFRDVGKVLMLWRYGVAWEAAGVAAGMFELALEYAKNREQFGKPIAGYQLIQQKLVEMATEVTLSKAMCFQLANLLIAASGRGNRSWKYNNARKARQVAMLARETLGGNDILIENHMRG